MLFGAPAARFAKVKIMHDIKAIRDNPHDFDEGLRRRGLEPRAESLLALDEKRRAAILALETARERRNAASKQIGMAMARKDTVAAEDFRAEVAGLKATMPELEAVERDATAALETELAAIPNLPLDDTPDGKDENDNVEIRRHGQPPSFPDGFKPKEHFEIGEALGLMDFDAAAKLSGARFVVLKGALARLERALEQFMLDLHTSEHGYIEVSPPVLVRDAGDVRHRAAAEVRGRPVRSNNFDIVRSSALLKKRLGVRLLLLRLVEIEGAFRPGMSCEQVRWRRRLRAGDRRGNSATK